MVDSDDACGWVMLYNTKLSTIKNSQGKEGE